MTPNEKLRVLRKERNLTTQQLGDLCGILQSTISKLENGKRNMGYETMKKLAKGLKVDIGEFLRAEEISEVSNEGEEELKEGIEKGIEEGIKEGKEEKSNDEKLQKGINCSKVYKKITDNIQSVESDTKSQGTTSEENDITQEFKSLFDKSCNKDGGPLFFNGVPLEGDALEEFEEMVKFTIRSLRQRNNARKK